MNFERNSAEHERPTAIKWASGLLTAGGLLLLLPSVLASYIGASWSDGSRAALLLVTTAALGGLQLVAAWRGWHGAAWPRLAVLAIGAIELGGLALGSGIAFALLVLALTATAAALLWRKDARAYSTAVGEATKRSPVWRAP